MRKIDHKSLNNLKFRLKINQKLAKNQNFFRNRSNRNRSKIAKNLKFSLIFHQQSITWRWTLTSPPVTKNDSFGRPLPLCDGLILSEHSHSKFVDICFRNNPRKVYKAECTNSYVKHAVDVSSCTKLFFVH